METVRHILQLKGYDVWSVLPDTTVFDALRLMADKGVGALLVMEGERLVGVMSERDYARKVILEGKASKETRVGDIMTRNVYTIHPEQTVEEAMDTMVNKHIRHLPVVENDQVIGVISIMDTSRHVIYYQREIIKNLTGRIPK